MSHLARGDSSGQQTYNSNPFIFSSDNKRNTIGKFENKVFQERRAVVTLPSSGSSGRCSLKEGVVFVLLPTRIATGSGSMVRQDNRSDPPNFLAK
jgi:hypothetical protein